MARFVLLDRDGVINRRVPNGYVTRWEGFEFLPGALDGLRLLERGGYAAIVVSNQACVGKGLVTPATLGDIDRRFVAEVEKHGGRIHASYYCPHRDEDRCGCRKPEPGLLLEAQSRHGFIPGETFLVGDSESDLRAAHAAGCRAILISQDDGKVSGDQPYGPVEVFSSLLEAAGFIIRGDLRN